MNNEALNENILRCLTEHSAAPLSPGQIGRRLELKGKALKQLEKQLHELVREGQIVRIRDNRYCMGDIADLVTGKLKVLRGGSGFVNPADGGAEVFVRGEHMGTALPGDQVMVRRFGDADTVPGGALDTPRFRKSAFDASTSGKVIRILERAHHDIVGTLKTTGRFFYVVPLDPIYSKDLYVDSPGEAAVGDRVVCRFTGWANRHVNPEAEILSVIGPWEDASADTLSIVKHYDLPDGFPDPVIREAEQVSALMETPGAREDLRGRLILTIDPEKSRDFDDALSLETDVQKRRVLGVHIADVAHFVRPGSALDVEAQRRGNSVYFPDRVIPMLPEQLSNGVCSLNPNVDRLAVSAFITVDADGKVLESRFARTIIRSKQRLTYEGALAVIGDGATGSTLAAPVRELLQDLHTLAQQMRRRRFAHHALELDMPECRVVVDAHGHMTGLKIEHNDVSHQLVEECMVAANEAVAQTLAARQIPLIHRLHEPPKDEKLEELTALLTSLKFTPGNLRQQNIMARFLKKLGGSALQNYARMAVLKSLNRAVYAADAHGHYGLAKTWYAHFTSPIRRYSDLVVHRQVMQLLGVDGGRAEYDMTRLKQLAALCTEREDVADQATRSLLEIKKYRYLATQAGKDERETYAAVIVSVMNFGLFVELIDYQIQGLIPISAISRRFVKYDRAAGTLRDGKREFSVGKRVSVTVENVDFDKRRIDFVME